MAKELIYEEEGLDQVKKLKKKLKECQKEKEEYLTQAQRARADLINYRRRQEQVLEEFKKFGQVGLIRELLPILDSLETVEPVKKQLMAVLKQYGVEEIKAVGKEFNPQYHEAVEMVKGKKSGIVAEEVQRGYLLGDKILRVSKVKVSN